MIASKEEMYKLLRAGVLGNRMHIFTSSEELRRFRGALSVRIGSGANGACLRWDNPELFAVLMGEWIDAMPKGVVLSKAAPDEHLILQGDALLEDGTLWTRTSTRPVILQDALRLDGVNREGRAAEVHLRRELGRDDYLEILTLLVRFPSHVVEFSKYAVPTGVEHRGLVIWEVRYY